MSVTRRGLLTGGAGLGVAGLTGLAGLAGCAEEPRRTSAAGKASKAEAEGPWEFVDGNGTRVTADERPSRVVAYAGAAAALWDFGVRSVGVFGPTQRSDTQHGNAELRPTGNLDLDTVKSIGEAWGEFDVEKYAALRPDLLVTMRMTTDENELWYVPDEVRDQVEQVAPTVVVRGGKVDLPTPIGMFGELAESLGADPEKAGVPQAKRRFERGTERLAEQAGSGRPLKVIAVSGVEDSLYVGVPDDHTDLAYFAEHGLDLVVPDEPDKLGFWQRLSWENADRFEADVVLWDSRAGNFTPKQFAAQPVFGRLPMADPARMLPWRVEAPFSYQQYAAVLEELVAGLEGARASIS